MAGSSSISGLSSGLDTATIIDQLMQLEAVPQNRLKTQQDTEKSVLTALRALNTDASLLASKAGSLAKPETWQTLKGTVTGSGVSVAVTATARSGTFSVTVDNVAVAHQFALTDTFALDDPNDAVVAGGVDTTVRIARPDGTYVDVETGTGTLQDVVDGINATTADTKVGATAVRVADGSYRLLLRSTETGAASEFTLTNVDGTPLAGGEDVATRQTGADAKIRVGGIAATSATNTFTDITPGVTLTLDAAATPGSTVSVNVAQDPSSVKTAVSALVDQVNALLTKIDGQTAGKTATTTAGVLAGDQTSRDLRNQLLETVFSGQGSMASLGIQTDRYGKLVFDGDAFAKAYAADPAGVAAKFTAGDSTGNDGWAARLSAVATGASESTTGTISTAIAGRNTTIDRLSDSIEDWDERLELRRSSLERTYTALETALNSLNSQSSWLAGQIAGLPTYSS